MNGKYSHKSSYRSKHDSTNSNLLKDVITLSKIEGIERLIQLNLVYKRTYPYYQTNLSLFKIWKGCGDRLRYDQNLQEKIHEHFS
jgi:hypothetical protein